ncbi:MAG: hypothetical protein ACREMI_11580 [Gemmatimonadales bacterium]
MSETERAHRPLRDGSRLAEFIYGTMSGLVALWGAGGVDGIWWEAGSSVVLGAAAVWLAHAYAELLSQRVVIGRHLKFHEFRAVLSSSWSILVAGLLLSTPFFPAGVGIVSVETATGISKALGVTVLALIGFYAEQTGKTRLARRLLLAGLSAGLGLGVVAAERLLSH